MDVRTVLPRDAIPSIDDPSFGAEYDGEADDEVIVVEGQRARAYPVRILHYHEVVNDVVDGVPLAVTWCPLCGSAVVYERLVEGRELTFGVSGKLADDDLVLYDRETESEWKQSSGVCIEGEFPGTELTARPILVRTSEQFRERYPEGTVLQPPGGASEAAGDDDPAPIDYDLGPYEAYFEGTGFGLAAHRGEDRGRAWNRDDLRPKERVLGVTVGDGALGFPTSRVDSVATATVGGVPVVVFSTPEGLDVFEDPGHDWTPAGSAGVFRADGTRWEGATGEAADGRRLRRLPSRRLFAFAWQDDHGPASFYGE